MISHSPSKRQHMLEEAKMLRVVQYGVGSLACAVSASVALTAYPFISESMHIPNLGAGAIAVSIPVVSGFAAHLVVNAPNPIYKGLSFLGFVGCVALSTATILHTKTYFDTKSYNAVITTNVEAAKKVAAGTNSVLTQILAQQDEATQTLNDSLANCSGKLTTRCKEGAQETYNATMEKLNSQFLLANQQPTPVKGAETIVPPQLGEFDFIMSAVPDFFAALLTFATMAVRRRRLQLMAAAETFTNIVERQPVKQRGPLKEAKKNLVTDIENNNLPPLAISNAGFIVPNRLAKYYGLHSVTVKNILLANVPKYIRQVDGKFIYNKGNVVALGVVK